MFYDKFDYVILLKRFDFKLLFGKVCYGKSSKEQLIINTMRLRSQRKMVCQIMYIECTMYYCYTSVYKIACSRKVVVLPGNNIVFF